MSIKNRIKQLFPLVMCLSITTACSNDSNEQVISKKKESTKLKSGNFVLQIKTPTEVRMGDKFELEGSIKYIGEKETYLLHGSKDIHFVITNVHGQNIDDDTAYAGVGMETKLKTGDVLSEKEGYKINKKGTYNIAVITSFDESVSGDIEDGKRVQMKINGLKLIVK
ncbi:hypothetical protein [Gottfriedia solisilvae]|uniref:hypothetical protein n=1 Tax=Gottfriedia solisilvae TaxID=1516104 RepID=UPI003D2EEE42